MSLPVAANKLCQVYHNPNTPPNAPDVANVPCFLKPAWVAGQEHGDWAAFGLVWTHIMLVDSSVDLRDSYGGQEFLNTAGDIITIPDVNGTKFTVIFIELLHAGTPTEHKRVYLDRHLPTWPTNEL